MVPETRGGIDHCDGSEYPSPCVQVERSSHGSNGIAPHREERIPGHEAHRGLSRPAFNLHAAGQVRMSREVKGARPEVCRDRPMTVDCISAA